MLFIVYLSIILLSSILFSKNLFEPLPQNIDYDENIVNLGKKLFFDPILSKDKTVSCSTCHSNYGADSKALSLGVNTQSGNINTPSVFNSSFNMAMFWNGRSKNLKEQLLEGPITNKHEMASSKEIIEERLNDSTIYKILFLKAYNKKPSYDLVIDSIVAFEKTLITPNSKFDKHLRGELELDKSEKEGFDLFVNYGCASCHNGKNIGGNSYQKFGTVIEYNENITTKWPDRFLVTKKESDKNVFRVPSLRNVVKTAPYFHSGDIKQLENAISLMAYYNLGLILKDSEIKKIKAFLETLTGELPNTWANDVKKF